MKDRKHNKQIMRKLCPNCLLVFLSTREKRSFRQIYCCKACSLSGNGKRNLGKRRTDIVKKNMSVNRMGSKNNFYGKKHLQATLDSISLKNTGRVVSLEVREKQSTRQKGAGNSFYGKKHSIESIALISKNHAPVSGELNPNYGNGHKISGSNNPSWKGGVSFDEYGREFNSEFKTKIRQRDLFTCYVCKENGFCVHHIDYNKKNNSMDNLITLCISCHAKTNFNREYWLKYFKECIK